MKALLLASLLMYNHIRKSIVFMGMLVAIVVVPMIASAGNGRYLISGSDQGLTAAHAIVGAGRHSFPGSFSSDLTGGQVRALEALSAVFDIHVEPVAQYYITARPDKCDPWPSCKNETSPTPTPDPVSRQFEPSDQVPWGIERIYEGADMPSTSGGAGVTVALLDTGVTVSHLDLARRIAQCTDFTARRGEVDGKCDDKNGHGTHTAGTIVADGGVDGLGIYGVAPEADLFAYKVCGNSGSCWSDDIAAAMRAAADRGADIISMSLGGDMENSLIRDAITYATDNNVLVVAAAGNDGPALGSIDYPGANTNVIAVGAIDISDAVASWSSRGVNDGDYIIEEREVEFAAPGVNVESTWNDGSYNTISGTSMATPHIAGLAAKVWQGSAAGTRDYLHGKAEDIAASGDDVATGFGIPHP